MDSVVRVRMVKVKDRLKGDQGLGGLSPKISELGTRSNGQETSYFQITQQLPPLCALCGLKAHRPSLKP